MINKLKIEKRMRELNLTQGVLAKELNLSQATISQKISGKSPITLDEAEKLCIILILNESDFREYFFANDIA